MQWNALAVGEVLPFDHKQRVSVRLENALTHQPSADSVTLIQFSGSAGAISFLSLTPGGQQQAPNATGRMNAEWR